MSNHVRAPTCWVAGRPVALSTHCAADSSGSFKPNSLGEDTTVMSTIGGPAEKVTGSAAPVGLVVRENDPAGVSGVVDDPTGGCCRIEMSWA